MSTGGNTLNLRFELAKRAEISRYSITKMGKDEDVSTDVLKKICDALHCRVEEIVDFIPEK